MSACARWLVVMGLGALCAAGARADIYTWVDANGVTHVSNVAPPAEARRLRVVRSAPRDPAGEAAQREAEVRALNARMQQLEADMERARGEAAQAAAAAVPAVQYVPVQQPQPVVVVVAPPAPSAPEVPAGCASPFASCFGFWPGYYPGVVFVRDRFSHKPRHDWRHPAPHHGRGFDRGPIAPPPVRITPIFPTGPYRK